MVGLQVNDLKNKEHSKSKDDDHIKTLDQMRDPDYRVLY